MPNVKDSATPGPVLQASWLRNDSDGNFWVQDNKQGPRPHLLFLGIEGERRSLCRREVTPLMECFSPDLERKNR